LRQEFKTLEQLPGLPIDLYDVIAVLSAEEVKIVGENKQRIKKAILLAEKTKNNTVIFLGTKLHNKFIKEYLKLDKIKIKPFFPTNRTQDSTRTQIKHLSVFLKKFPYDKVLIVSTAYHIPRIRRYCQHYLIIKKCGFYAVGKIYNQQNRVDSEINKIIQYAGQGDLPLWVN